MRTLGALTFLLVLAGCSTTRAPAWRGAVWAGEEPGKLVAQLRFTASALPTGWLVRAEREGAAGSYHYRKRSGSYRYSDRGYFSVLPKWEPNQDYVGLLTPEGAFCVVNPEMQGGEEGDSFVTYKVYDYCAPLRRL